MKNGPGTSQRRCICFAWPEWPIASATRRRTEFLWAQKPMIGTSKPCSSTWALLCRALGLSVRDIESAEDVLWVNNGAVCEQFIGQHLLYSGPFYQDPELYCWMREKRASSAELDFVIAIGTTVVPVEVKAGKTGTLRSLHQFLREKGRDLGLRFNSEAPSLLDSQTALPDGKHKPFRLVSLPLNMVGQARRLCAQALHPPGR